MNRFLLFIAITLLLIVGSLFMTVHMEQNALHTDDSDLYSWDGEGDTWESERYTNIIEDNDPADESYVVDEVVDNGDFYEEMDDYSEGTMTSEEVDSYEIIEQFEEDEDWAFVEEESEFDESIFHEPANLQLVTPATEWINDGTDWTIIMPQMDFMEHVQEGRFPGLGFTLGDSLVPFFEQNGGVSIVEGTDADTYFWRPNGFGLRPAENESLTLTGILLPIHYSLDDLRWMFGEPNLIQRGEGGQMMYTYIIDENHLVFHASSDNDEWIRAMELY
ncbi:hypothetical protein MHZ92_08005 [Sporosarcina sp. ACRSL]|uniref:hypothetical protein n=1 Tax=Sporosarcina sp. ACRSL TaxID=2918215 RepID=UPI001EF61037|nr:hypothetical protein [Sporosarcina sp. ACRSL]MCG7344071.1 hypothetical protein [Sporosarcina sp. ACRSL]